jgi:ABC-type transport system involved in multi-copper enzyme maturation permease subunit
MSRGTWFLVARSLGFFAVLELILIPALLYWPDFEENIGAFKKLVPFLKGKNLVGLLEVTGVEGYVIAQHYFKGCMMLGIPAAVLFSMGAVAGEAHRGSLEIWLAQPISRNRLLIERWVQGALAVVLPVFASSLTIPWLLSFVDETLPYDLMLLSSVHSVALLLATYSATFLLSTVGRRPVLIAFFMLSLMMAQGAVYIVETITQWSIFRLVDIPEYLKIFETGKLDPSTLLPLYGASLVFLIASLFAFSRRVP